jgi:3-oxoacyl-[acyl-carrier protein] reductase
MNLNLGGKTAIVTGGGHGLGRAICLCLAAEGVNISVNYNNSGEQAQQLLDDLRDHDVKAIAVKGDVSSEADVTALFDKTEEMLGDVTLLVNNAGICPVAMIKDMEVTEWQRVLDINMSGVFLTCRDMIRRLTARGQTGAVVNISSLTAYIGSKRGKTAYSASKGGVVTFTTSLAKEVAADGIRVNAVAPGMMYTDMTKDVLDHERQKYDAQIPLGRIGEVEETARVVAFLLSDASSYITGATIDVSGGIMGR